MSLQLTLVKVTLRPDTTQRAEHPMKQPFESLLANHMITGASAWRSLQAGNDRLIVIETTNDGDGNRLAEAVSDDYFLAAANELIEGVPDLTVIKVHKSMGLQPHEMLDGSIISESRRVADPGGAQTLFNDYQVVFEELTPIPGFRGWAYGSSASAAEAVIGLGYWDDLQALQSSIPAASTYRIDSYQKAWNLA